MRTEILTNVKMTLTWNELEWKLYFTKTQETQERLVMAHRLGKKELVLELQRNLVTSFEGRALAVRKVVTNNGNKTPGIDGVIWDTGEKRMSAIALLSKIVQKPSEYRASPVKRVWIPKENSTEKRPLGIPTMIDRATQALYHMAIDPIVEEESDKHSYGFRKYRSTHDAILRIRTLLDKSYSPKWILEADIEKCFDRILHQFLIEKTVMCDKIMLIQWLKSGIMEKGEFFTNSEKGTPQGGILSPTLCNIALNGLETRIQAKAMQYIKKPTKTHVIRYADDFIITGQDVEILKGPIKEECRQFLEERGLVIKETKTKITFIEEGFQFLGFSIKRYQWNPKKNRRKTSKVIQKTLLIIKPSQAKVKDLKKRIKKIIQIQKPMESIIRDINPLLRGWSEYYRISYHGQVIFWNLGHWLHGILWSWARKKHANRRANWIYETYVWEKDGTKWNFGTSAKQTIFNIASVTNLKLVALKEGLNPYIRENEEYFVRRKIARIQTKFRSAIYKLYKHKCQHCNQTLHGEEPIELHHIVPEKEGGKWTLNNIVPLHRLCHQNITHKPVKLTKE